MIKHLYIHIPFCKRICSYCDFNKRVSNNLIMKSYLIKLLDELDEHKNYLKDIETIYIGGGTPSFYPYIENVLKKINDIIDINKIKEYSIETTPETINNIIPFLNKYKINRVSIGVESLNIKTLEYINRPVNTLITLKEAIKNLKNNGINNINFDLIYSLPYETLDSIKEGLNEIFSLNPTHISYYDLIVEEKTKLYYDLSNKKINLVDEDQSIEMMDYINDELEKHGFNRYEISNYSKEGYESIHNLSYWDLEDYLGLGAGAHSLILNKRFNNSINVLEYINNNKREYYSFDRNKEYFLMGLRKTKGASISKYNELFKSSMFDDYKIINKRIDEGLLEVHDDYLRFTKKGINIGNIVFEDFV